MCLSSWVFHIRETFCAQDVVSTVPMVVPRSCWQGDNLVDFSVNSSPWILGPVTDTLFSQLEKVGQSVPGQVVDLLILSFKYWWGTYYTPVLLWEWSGREDVHSAVLKLTFHQLNTSPWPHQVTVVRGDGWPTQLGYPGTPRSLGFLLPKREWELSEMLVDRQHLCCKSPSEMVVVKPTLLPACKLTHAFCGSGRDIRTSVQNWPERWVWVSHAEWEEEG